MVTGIQHLFENRLPSSKKVIHRATEGFQQRFLLVAFFVFVLFYFFAHPPWLLANEAGEHGDERFEHAAWYKDRQGAVLPVVEALKADPRKGEVRQWAEAE